MKKITDLFRIVRGKGEYKENLASGQTPLVSASTHNNGIIGEVEIEPTFHAPGITVERVSGKAYVQLVDFATVPDDMSVLIPKKSMTLRMLFYIAANINLSRWRFSYGRKLTGRRIEDILIDFSNYVERKTNISSLIPKNKAFEKPKFVPKFEEFSITELLYLSRGNFHALDKLDIGKHPTVSRSSENNGIVGNYEMPEGTKLHEKGTLTVSTVTGDSFIQFEEYMATDNVLICKPKMKLRLFTMLYLQMAINQEKWRFSYGRQPYLRIFSTLKVFLPTKEGSIDEDYIENLVKSCYGWDQVVAAI